MWKLKENNKKFIINYVAHIIAACLILQKKKEI
jgi:hypothetical protein